MKGRRFSVRDGLLCALIPLLISAVVLVSAWAIYMATVAAGGPVPVIIAIVALGVVAAFVLGGLTPID